MDPSEQLRMTECLLVQALIEKEELRNNQRTQKDHLVRGSGGLVMHSTEMPPDILLEENTALQKEVARLRGVAGFPGEVELVVKVKGEGGKMIERGAQEEDLRRLCDANGLTVLKKGQYICSRCGGIRCTTECKFCPE